MSNIAYALTTIDNPYDPFVQFEAWYRYDLNRELTHRDELYVNCCSMVDRYAETSDTMSDAELSNAIELAIDEIIKYDQLNVYKKVRRDVEEAEEIEVNEYVNSIAENSKFLNH